MMPDFSILSLPILVLLPLIFGLYILTPLCPQSEVFVRRFAKGASVFHLFYTGLFLAFYNKGFVSMWQPTWIGTIGCKFGFVMDELALLMTILTSLIFTLAIIASKAHIRKAHKLYYALFLFFESTILGIFNAGDAFTFFLFWELELIPAYFLIAHWGEGVESKRSAMKFVLYTFIGSLFMLLGLILLHYFSFLVTGSMNAEISAYDMNGVGLILQVLVSVLLLIGFGVKLPIVPIHSWLPDAHTDAPTPVSMVLAGVLLKTGAYAIIRFNLQLLPEAFKALAPILAVIALVNIIFAALVAYAQTDIKRIVAFSSISNMGLVLLGICSINKIGLTGSIFHMVAHGLITAGLFMVCGIVFLRCKTRDITCLGGLAQKMPRLFGFATIIVVAAVGMPLLPAFIGEVLTVLGAMAAEFSAIMKFIALLSLPMLICASCYMLKFLHQGFFGQLSVCKPNSDIMNHEFVVLSIIVLCLLVLGVYPMSIINIVNASFIMGGNGIW